MSDFVRTIDVGDAQRACLTNGLTLLTAGAGIADLTLGFPTPGSRVVIRLVSVDGGQAAVVTAATGATLDGTNTIATFDTAEDGLVLVYDTATAWAIARNTGVVLS